MITPHVSAPSLPDDVAKLFARNLAAYAAEGEEGDLEYVVNFARGY